MKIKFLITFVALLMALPCCLVLAENDSRHTFDQLKTLVGEWQGTLPDGKPIEISYLEINGGAILELYRSSDPMWWNMSSVYHRDVDHIVMSHYCSWGNHPRMINSGQRSESDRIDFQFLDISMTAPEHGYMRASSIQFKDDNHFNHHWTWREEGKDTPLVVKMKRKPNRS